jgi:hypothetical protein
MRPFKIANTYTLNGATPQGTSVQIRYATTSLAGTPTLEFTRGAAAPQHFDGAQISSARTALGTEVTVGIASTPGAYADSFTLILPEVHVAGQTEGLDVLGILVRQKRSGGPQMPQGELATYTAIPLSGTAEFRVY